MTGRAGPAATPAHADALEALARCTATRIDLRGLDVAETAALIQADIGRAPSQSEAESLRARTGGNPFFLHELTRISETNDVPATVGDMVARRLAALPEATRELLRGAAVVGESLISAFSRRRVPMAEDDALDSLEPAIDSGIVRTGADPDVSRLAHALVRDAAYARLPSSRRARLHGAVALALEAGAAAELDWNARATQKAWHWLAAGPRWAARAWRAASAAARTATALHAYDESAALLLAAVESASRDPDCSPEQRYDLLLCVCTRAWPAETGWLCTRWPHRPSRRHGIWVMRGAPHWPRWRRGRRDLGAAAVRRRQPRDGAHLGARVA